MSDFGSILLIVTAVLIVVAFCAAEFIAFRALRSNERRRRA